MYYILYYILHWIYSTFDNVFRISAKSRNKNKREKIRFFKVDKADNKVDNAVKNKDFETNNFNLLLVSLLTMRVLRPCLHYKLCNKVNQRHFYTQV